MLLRYNASDKSGVKVELRRTKKGNLVQVREVVEGDYETTRRVYISCLMVASKYMEQMTREYENDHGVIFNANWMR